MLAVVDGWRSRALVPVLVFLGLVVAAIGSLGAPLVPTVAAVDGVSIGAAQWTLTITLLVGAIATPVLGRLGDGARRREVILAAVATVLAGSVLCALPLGFGYLLAGRALQGFGLGLVPLAIATARDNLRGERAGSAIALLSITSAAGIGLGYPVTALIAQHFELRAAYWFGAAVSALAFVLASLVVPSTAGRPARRLDGVGAALLGLALAGLLLALSEGAAWGWTSARVLGLVILSLLLLIGWVRHERRCRFPLVDLVLARQRAVLTANLTVAFAGAGVYELLSLLTRYVQTPTSTSYGFGSSVVIAGLILLPFSAASLLASRLTRWLLRQMAPERALTLSCAVMLVAMLTFTVARSELWQAFVTMGIAGLGVGLAFAVVPVLIVGAVPADETSSAISLNQVVRTVGFSTGSALSAVVLSEYTQPGAIYPSADGYRAAALVGSAILAGTVVAGLVSSLRLDG